MTYSKGTCQTLAYFSIAVEKMDQSASSTLLTEANAMSEGLAHAEWISTWLGLAKNIHYDIRKRDQFNREIKLVSIMKEPQELTISGRTGAKSLYDDIKREQYTEAEKSEQLSNSV